ncbi:MAG: MBL fold metallo-hydrolase [Bdellovibrionota bacterium]
MKLGLEFLGAAGQVTGSRTLLSFFGKRYLVDYGLFQGGREQKLKNWDSTPKEIAKVERIFLTHAHLDHSGMLPRLFKEGYHPEVWCTEGTAALLKILLLDAAHIQEEDARYANDTGHSKHRPALPLYTEKDAYKVLEHVKTFPRDEWVPVDKGISLRFGRAGHILGASYITFTLETENGVKLLTFSGDIGNNRSYILKGPDPLIESDYLVLESTYGNRLHDPGDPLVELGECIREVYNNRGVLVIPAFAAGRSQELLYMIKLLEDSGKIPKIDVLLDSPMATKATDAFLQHKEDHKFDNSFTATRDFYPSQFQIVETPDDSMLACMREGPLIVIAGAGMLNGGRVLHHLKKRLPRKENMVLFSGFQAESTKGRYLLEEAPKSGFLRIHHQEIAVEAQIKSISSLSAHADSNELLSWCSHMKKAPKKVFLNHGQPEAMQKLTQRLKDELHWNVEPILSEQKIMLF